ncbi:general secretion pathway protein J [Vibrio ishigakensis]|uniref:General secretion pathway protein J n=1 Tax=Vibrio ishigakensis TaxID=1481914 RepID=A0A0B8QCB2_9VIBR|nr:general secretion pathway protein J [Vibrio ishigakensis]GAM77295.1 general secretion pathway protein J [Vibrio ishigakensis]
MLDSVESFDLRFYNGEAWSQEWDETDKLPKAIAVNLELKDYGEIERIYLTADGQLERVNEDEPQ